MIVFFSDVVKRILKINTVITVSALKQDQFIKEMILVAKLHLIVNVDNMFYVA